MIAFLIALLVVAGAATAVAFFKASLLLAVMLAPLVIVGASAGGIALALLVDEETDESFELSSHWGGLGSGLGGWRLSRPAALVVIMLIAMVPVAIALVRAGP